MQRPNESGNTRLNDEIEVEAEDEARRNAGDRSSAATMVRTEARKTFEFGMMRE